MFSLEILERAHRYTSRHREEVMTSGAVGCFSCLEVYPPEEIQEWIDHGQTAICPRCHIDTVLPERVLPPDIEPFLQAMSSYWLGSLTPRG